METFTLRNDEPKSEPWVGTDAGEVRHRQTVLFSGLDCLPGQMDLFATDGEETEDDR